MHLARLRPSSRTVARAALLAALAVASLSLTHCRMVGDTTTGITASVLKAKSCLGICQNNADAATKDEDKLHKDNLSDCTNTTCVNQENARHDAAIAAIQAALVACQNNCHQQGGGGVGP